MPWAYEGNTGYSMPCSVGPRLLTAPTLATLPTAAPIAAAGNWSSGLLPSDGYPLISVGLQSTQAGQIVIQRYLDNMLGLTPQGAALTQAITANTPVVLNCTDEAICGCFTIEVTNTGGAAATISNFAVLMSAA